MKNAKKTEKYRVTTAYSERNGAHTVVETWTCEGARRLADVLKEALDLIVTPDGKPAEPEMETLNATLGRYAGGDFVEREYRRGKKAYAIWTEATAPFPPGVRRREWKADRNTTLTVEAVPEGKSR